MRVGLYGVILKKLSCDCLKFPPKKLLFTQRKGRVVASPPEVKDSLRACDLALSKGTLPPVFAEFRPLFPFLRPLWGKFALGMLAAICYGVASGAGLPLLTTTALPMIFQDPEKVAEVPTWFKDFSFTLFGNDVAKLTLFSCIFLPFIFLLRGLGGYFSSFWMSEVGTRGVEGFRKHVFNSLLEQPLAFFQTRVSGDLLSRVIADTAALQGAVVKTAGDLVKQPIVLVSALVFLVMQALEKEGVFFALIGGLSIPLLVFPIRVLGKRLKKRSAALQEKAGEMSGMASEVIMNPLEVRAYNLEGRFGSLFGTIAGDWRKLELKLIRYSQILSPLVEVVAAIGFAFSLYLGAQKGMGLDDFLGMATALFMAYEPVKKLGSLHGILESAKAAMARIAVILDAENTVPEPVMPLLPEEAKGEIIFDQVRFAYGEEEVLKGVSVTVKSGETVALVGESGGGKTTFASLIPRFYEVSSGAILIDGINVKDYATEELRKRIALVPQMPVLFRGTIRENILMGRPEASQEEVEMAAKRAYAHAFIQAQDLGYDTIVSEKGSSLSGGQRQRVAIARAFLKDAPILILDEATSALDSESEAKVQKAITELAKGRTTLMITHRASTQEFADRALFFEKGVVSDSVAS